MSRSRDEPAGLPGVTALEHTADVGLEIHAATLPALFDRAAVGTMALVHGAEEVASGASAPPPTAAPDHRTVRLEAADRPALLLTWLRELLYLQEVEGFVYQGASFTELSDQRIVAAVTGGPPEAPAEREIKGVTWHGLEVEREQDGWRARVIFDV